MSVINFPDINNPNHILNKAIGEFEEVLVIGLKTDGTITFSGSFEDAPMILFCLEYCKKQIMDSTT